MNQQISYFSKQISRIVIVWLVDAVALFVMVKITRNVSFIENSGYSNLTIALAVTLIIGAINFFIRPSILLLAKKSGLIALVLATILVNAFILIFISNNFNLIEVGNLWSALVASIIFALINVVITNMLTISDNNSFYQKRIERIAKKELYDTHDKSKGMVVIEIDGLSFPLIKKALDRGYLPTVQKLIDSGYKLNKYDCGLPSQTSACQAGIMFGDNYDIPAFRWYDKDKKRLFVSGKDAAEINKRYANGKGILRGGTSIDNMMSGDAQKSLLTLADANMKDEKFKKTHADDLYLLMIDPNFFMRTLGLFIADAFLEIFQYSWQVLNHETPRPKRLKHYYPLLRAATTVLTRDISTNLAVIEIVRGTPALYMTWAGYDEVAHHSGPSSKDALGTLKRFDKSISKIYKATIEKNLRPYEFFLISDHGQSYGATFKQRYGYDLKEFIENSISKKYRVSQSIGGDDGTTAVSALADDIGELAQDDKKTGKRAVAKTSAALSKIAKSEEAGKDIDASHVTVCGSGNIAQIYFDFSDKKIGKADLDRQHPGLIDSLVSHEGVGFVVVYDDTGVPVVLGKEGERNLHTGKIKGKDPLKPYGDTALRARQIKRIADFPHAGDLIVNSTIYPDGTVAALEELIGSHGGLGGDQTDAFILHPKSVKFSKTENSTDLYKILNRK